MSNEAIAPSIDGDEQTGTPAAGSALEGDGMRGWAEALVDRARSEGLALTGEDGLLTAMVREVLQTGLDVEMADHLGYEPYEAIGRGSGNSRKGAYAKTVRTDVGPVELRMPRNRQGTFEPVTVPKHVRRLEGLGANVISLYAKGLTTGEIQAHLAEIYDTEVSRETISKITDQVLPDMAAWQSRPAGPRAVSNGGCESVCDEVWFPSCHQLGWCAVLEACSWPVVELACDFPEALVGDLLEVGSLGEVLA